MRQVITATHSDGVERSVTFDDDDPSGERVARRLLHDASPEGKAEFEAKMRAARLMAEGFGKWRN